MFCYTPTLQATSSNDTFCTMERPHMLTKILYMLISNFSTNRMLKVLNRKGETERKKQEQKICNGCKSILYFLVVVRLPLMMRVEVDTDLKLPIPPPMLSIPSMPPKEEKEVKSTGGETRSIDTCSTGSHFVRLGWPRVSHH